MDGPAVSVPIGLIKLGLFGHPLGAYGDHYGPPALASLLLPKLISRLSAHTPNIFVIFMIGHPRITSGPILDNSGKFLAFPSFHWKEKEAA